jgi:plastin-1
MEGKVHLVLGLIWQIIRIGLMSAINLKNHPYLIRLLEPGETLEDLMKLSPEQILLRWFNYHLKNAGTSRRVNNFGGDIKDSECYTLLLNQLSPKNCNKDALQQSNMTKRAEMVLANADKINCKKFVKPRDIVAGNPKLNLAFVANMFNTCPGLEPVTEVVVVDEETREEKAFRNWMNSLGVDPFVNNLYEDLRDGIILLQTLDKISPGIVDWSKVNTKKPLNKFKQVENCNYAIVLGKQLKFSLVGVAGSDINDANKKLTLAIVWQAMRYYVLNYLKLAFKGKSINDDDIVRWANDKVKGSGKGTSFEGFKDKSLGDSIFIMDLLAACQPESVNFDLVTGGQTDEDKLMNAKYAISCARKMGCAVFLLPEDIVEVQPKLMMTFFAAVMATFGQ